MRIKAVESRQVAVRTRCGKNLDSLSLDEFIATLEASIALRGRVE